LKEEQVLVRRLQQGEKTAFRELVERYQKKIYYLAYDLTGNHHDAEDLSQEVFIKAFRSLHNFRGDAKLSSWLYRITVNTAISQKRKKSVSKMQLQENFEENIDQSKQVNDTEFSRNPEKKAEAGLMRDHIDRAIQKLTPREKSIFVLRHYNDLPQKEIAEILKINLGTVKSMLFRALKKLQKELSFYREELGLEVYND
jgi:RNA polymerase sigma-70 factor, ECF subfamily